jgi:prolyl-tRNA synthetase
MRQSRLFSKTIKKVSREEKSANSQFLIRAGFIDKLMAGVYSYLPLGFKVLKKIERIIREEINEINGFELLMPVLHPKEIWQKTDRWKYPEMFKLKNRQGKDFGLGWTHEEVIVPLVGKFLKSYKDLPFSAYQIQNKFRDELRSKSGLLRGTEFIMKDLYSFHENKECLDKYYEKVKKTYFKIFQRCGLKKETFLTLASGGAFSPYSHEFQTVTEFGEDEIYLCLKCRLAVNKEIIEKEKHRCPKCGKKGLEAKKSIEVGNIFKLQDRFSRAFNLTFQGRDGKEKPVLMGCYGIGLGRLMGAVVEAHHDEKGIIWPCSIAPFDIHLLVLDGSGRTAEEKVKKAAEKLYQDIKKEGVDVLYDDRDKSAGEKFADADLIGIPYRIVVSKKILENNCLEVKKRNKKEIKLIKISNLKQFLSDNL